jgi:hypothetical protein
MSTPLNIRAEDGLKAPPDAPDTEHDRAIRDVADAVHRANEAVRRAVNAGISVELIRVSRYHDGGGSWGDQMIPALRERMPPGH